jgi:hypothetical protein
MEEAIIFESTNSNKINNKGDDICSGLENKMIKETF